MIIAIVGSEKTKFTPRGKAHALALIHQLISAPEVTEVVSGGCHLGGIDSWARDVTIELGKKITEYFPRKLNWERGYKPRNIQIARRADVTHCITVNHLPHGFSGLTHKLCYHCGTHDHVKSGGCWTMHKAQKMGKLGQLHIIEN